MPTSTPWSSSSMRFFRQCDSDAVTVHGPRSDGPVPGWTSGRAMTSPRLPSSVTPESPRATRYQQTRGRAEGIELTPFEPPEPHLVVEPDRVHTPERRARRQHDLPLERHQR